MDYFRAERLLRRVAVLLLLSLSVFGAHAQVPGPAAQVVFAKGETSIQLSGKFEPLLQGARVAEGALLQTGADGHLYLKLADDGFFVLRPNTQARIAVYRPVPERPADSEFRLELLQGVARAITGKVAEQAKERFRLNTPVAAIGIKGTDFVVSSTADATYVSVYSGGVVASPFMANCTRDGLGSCKSSSSATLLASNSTLLEIRAGTQRVQTLDLKANPALRHLLPDQTTPPAKGEDALRNRYGETDMPASSRLTMAENPSANAALLKSTLLPASTAPTNALPVAPVPETAQTIFWGRYAEIAGLDKNSVDLAAFMKGLEPIGISWPAYVVARTKDSLAMPSEGTASFNLRSSEVGIFLGNGSASAIPATILNPTLSVDFGTREYATQLTVAGGGYSGNFVSKGTVMANGVFDANAGRSNMTLYGGLSGTPVDQAAYVFMGRLDSNAVAAGGTFWRRAP